MTATQTIRSNLGDFNSIVCFRALVVGVEEALGHRAAMVSLKAAGRRRGEQLVASLGLTGAAPEDPTAPLNAAVGKEGTRLCRVDKIERADGKFRIYLSETVCSAEEPPGSTRELSFTFGAVHGAIEALYGLKLRGEQVGSVLRGQDHDIMELWER